MLSVAQTYTLLPTVDDKSMPQLLGMIWRKSDCKVADS